MDDAQLAAFEGGLRDAEMRGDAAYLEVVLAEDFVGVGPRGFVLTRAEWLERHRSGDLKYSMLERDETAVRLFGDTAIATSHETSQASYQGRALPPAELRTTQVFVRSGDAWKLAAVHMSPIMPPIQAEAS